MHYKNIFFFTLLFITSCVNHSIIEESSTIKKTSFFSNKGFALVYNDELFKEKIVKGKIEDRSLFIFQKNLKKDTPVKITNLHNSKYVLAKVAKKTKYPNFYNSVISKRISDELELDELNPYIEIKEIVHGSSFVAKKAKTYKEEKNVAEKAPVDNIKMDDITEANLETNAGKTQSKTFILVISDFYYFDSANNLKEKLIKKTKSNNISVKKINNNKYRLLAGPFESFNALKTTYISLNNLGFENLNIYRE